MCLFLYPGFTAYLLFYLSFWSKFLLKEISDRRAEPAFCAPQPFIMWAQADKRAPLEARAGCSCGSCRVSPWSVGAGPSCPALGKPGSHGTDCCWLPFPATLLYLPAANVCHLQGFQMKEKKAKLKEEKKKRDCFSVFYLARLYHYIMQVHFKHYRSSGG